MSMDEYSLVRADLLGQRTQMMLAEAKAKKLEEEKRRYDAGLTEWNP